MSTTFLRRQKDTCPTCRRPFVQGQGSGRQEDNTEESNERDHRAFSNWLETLSSDINFMRIPESLPESETHTSSEYAGLYS